MQMPKRFGAALGVAAMLLLPACAVAAQTQFAGGAWEVVDQRDLDLRAKGLAMSPDGRLVAGTNESDVLCIWDIETLDKSCLDLSEYFERHRDTYIDLLFTVSQRGAWEDWVCLVLDTVEEQAGVTVERAQSILDLREAIRSTYQTNRAGKILTVIDVLFERPSLTVAQAASAAQIAKPDAKYIIDQLVRDGVLVEWSGRQRNRAFIAPGIAGAALGRPLERRR